MTQSNTESDNELAVKIKPEVEGFGDTESHTIDQPVAETIAELIRQNLRNRYEHLTPDTEINVIGLSAPNTVAIHYRQPGENENNESTSD